MSAKIPTGPKSTAGKKVASRNATKHGLTAEHPLTQAEDERLVQLLKALNKEYKPKTITEEILVERVANTQLKIERQNKVERAMFESARRSASDTSNILEELEFDQELKEVFIAHSVKQAHNPKWILPGGTWEIAHARLLSELRNYGQQGDWAQNYSGLIRQCPELHKRVCFYCDHHLLKYSEFFTQLEEKTTETVNELAELLTSDAIEPDVTAPEPVGPSFDEIQIDKELIEKLPRLLHQQLRDHSVIPIFTELIEKSQEVDGNAAMPSEAQMNQIIRYSTTLNNQLSKAVGELRLVIKERKNEEASLEG